MADVNHPTLEFDQWHKQAYGNEHVFYKSWTTSSFTAGDELILATLPQGARVHDVVMTISDPSNASVTVDVGHKQIGPGSWTDDSDYFMDAQPISATAAPSSRGVRRHQPLAITADCVALVVTVNAAITQQTVIGFTVYYEYVGNL